ncbi:MAG TPA: hypothetical protein VIJ93_03320, partial [bacterium]
VFICFHLWQIRLAFAADATKVPSLDQKLSEAGQKLEKSKAEVQALKDAWDKARLETTLYQQRSQRAYKRWVKAAKKLREQARVQKEKAELELQLAVEKRKLAYGQWQSAIYHYQAGEFQVKALDQEKDTAATQEKIRQIEAKLNPSHN